MVALKILRWLWKEFLFGWVRILCPLWVFKIASICIYIIAKYHVNIIEMVVISQFIIYYCGISALNISATIIKTFVFKVINFHFSRPNKRILNRLVPITLFFNNILVCGPRNSWVNFLRLYITVRRRDLPECNRKISLNSPSQGKVKPVDGRLL